MKKVLGILICLCMFLLCGCGVPTQYTLEQNADGEVTQTIYVPYYKSELINYGITSDVAQDIAEDIGSELNNRFLARYDNFFAKLYSDDGLSTFQKNQMLSYCPEKNDMLGKSLYFENSTEKGITYTFTFKNAIAYYYFNSDYTYNELKDVLNKDDSKVVSNFLTTDKVNTSVNKYGEKVYISETGESMRLANYINKRAVQILEDKIENTELKNTLTDEQKTKIYEEIPPKEFIYRFGTTSKRLHSDADKVRYLNGIYYHEWNITLDNSTREISTWTKAANRNVWYGLALGLSLVLVAVLMVVFRKDKKVA